MAHSFKTNPGKRTFGVLVEPKDAGEYIINKKSKYLFCNTNCCTPDIKFNGENDYLLFKNLNCFNTKQNNTYNLSSNLITKLNLTDVPVIQDFSGNVVPTPINSSVLTPYLRYNIDPSGNLFGNDICGINNYLNYLQYNPPNL
jgi:hypothetical protein